jgi:hypothetical protein
MPVPVYLSGVVIILIFLDLAKLGTRPNGVGLSADLLPKKTISFLDEHWV